MLEQLFDWFSTHIVLIGYPAIFLLLVLESLVLFIPSEIVLPFIGFLAYEGEFHIVTAVVVATLGSLVGAVLMYEASRRGGRRFVRTYGRYILLNEEHLAWSEGLYRRYGEKTLFFSRLIPVVRQLISIPAGTTGTDRTKFIVYTFTGSFLWNALLISAGFFLGKEWYYVTAYMQPLDIFVIVIVGAIIAWLVFKEIEKRTFLKYVRPRIIKGSRRFLKRMRRR